MSISERVVATALQNGGTITAAEAQALGANRQWIQRRTRDGWLQRTSTGSYVLSATASVWRATLASACRKLGAVVSHESALELYGLTGVRSGLMVVTVPVRHTNRYPGVVVHQKTDLTPAQVTTTSGLPSTTPERTLIDLAAQLGPKRLGRLVDQAVASRLTTYASVGELFASLARRGKPGVKSMRAVLADRGADFRPPDTVLEAKLLDLIESAGLPRPIPQFRAHWLAPTEGRVDMAYVDKRLVIEADGRRWHQLADAFLNDRERDNLAMLAGWRVLRFTWWDIHDRPGYVIGLIRDAFS